MNLPIILGMVGPWQIIIIALVIVLLFGGKKIPEMFKGIGEGLKEFKKAAKGDEEIKKEEVKKEEVKEEPKKDAEK